MGPSLCSHLGHSFDFPQVHLQPVVRVVTSYYPHGVPIQPGLCTVVAGTPGRRGSDVTVENST